jgi:CHAT domain-containing protein
MLAKYTQMIAIGLVWDCSAPVMILAGTLLVACHPEPTVLSKVRRAWDSSFAAARPLEARLVATRHAPFRADEGMGEARKRFIQEVRPYLRQILGKRSASALQAAALTAIVVGNLDKAAAALTAEVQSEPNRATALSDLAAVYIGRAERKKEPHDLVLALDAAERAATLDPRLAAAAYNRALALEHLLLRGQARVGWAISLTRESDFGWAAEARARLKLNSSVIEPDDWRSQQEMFELIALAGKPAYLSAAVRRFPQAARELAEESALPRWGWASLNGRRAEAHSALTTARAVGAALSAGSGERMINDAVEVIEARASKIGDQRLHQLALGHLAYGQGMALYERRAFRPAAARFARADWLLRQARSPFAGWARFQLARCLYQQADYKKVLLLLNALASDEPDGHLALRGRTLRMLGLVCNIEGRPVEALERVRESKADFQRLHELGSLSAVDALAAEALSYLGRTKEAWQALASGLEESDGSGTAAASATVLEGLVQAAAKEGLLFAARDVANEVVLEARRTKEPLRIVAALHDRAGFIGASSAGMHVLSDIAEAKRVAAHIPDAEARLTVVGDLLMTEGRLWRPLDPSRSIFLLKQALDVYRQTGYRFALAATFLELGRAYLAAGQEENAEKALQGAVGAVERQRREVSDFRSRDLCSLQCREVFDELIDFEIDRRRRADLAFGVAEEGRAMTLLEAVVSAHPPAASNVTAAKKMAASTAEILATLPPGLLLIEFHFAKGRLLIWAFGHGRLHHFVPGTNSTEIERLSRDFKASLASGEDGGPASSALYDHLIRPFSALLRTGDDLVLVPDGPLYSIPFAALRDGSRFLVEEHTVCITPSASFLASSLMRQDGQRARSRTTALAVGDPAFAQSLFPRFRRLPGAAEEALEVAQALPGSVVLLGEKATRSAFLAGADKHTVVHFGGHAVINPDFPLLSQLVFAPRASSAERGVLYARDLLGYRFPRTRLVVLAACRGADGSGPDGLGLSGLSEAFLSTGIPAVLAHLWNLDDQHSSAFFRAFYRQIGAGLPPEAALRATQIELLRGGEAALRAPQNWAGFELFGSCAACSLRMKGVRRHNDHMDRSSARQ